MELIQYLTWDIHSSVLTVVTAVTWGKGGIILGQSGNVVGKKTDSLDLSGRNSLVSNTLESLLMIAS